jgi:hypothetical protein
VSERFFEPSRFNRSQQGCDYEFASGTDGNHPRTAGEVRSQFTVKGGSAFPGSAVGYPAGSGLGNERTGFVGTKEPPA